MPSLTLIRQTKIQPDPAVPTWQWGISSERQALAAAAYHGLPWPLAPGS